MTDTPSPAPTVKGGLYWRQSKWSGKKCVPAILATDGHTLWLTSGGTPVFSVPTTQAGAEFSRLHTLTVTADGTRYALVGKPANLSPKFTQAELDELAASHDTLSEVATTSHTWITGISPVAGGMGALVDLRAMAKTIEPWRPVLTAAGVAVS